MRTRNTNGRIYILLSSFLFSCGHSPKADKLITNEIIQVIETSKQYKQTSFYYAEIYSSHVKWELFINGTQMFANYRGNITVPLNYNILGSGKKNNLSHLSPMVRIF